MSGLVCQEEYHSEGVDFCFFRDTHSYADAVYCDDNGLVQYDDLVEVYAYDGVCANTNAYASGNYEVGGQGAEDADEYADNDGLLPGW